MSDDKTISAKKTTAKNWIHPDEKMQEGVTYNVKYVGRIGINESMKSLNFETRTQVARESIRRVAECAKLLVIPRRYRKTNEDQLNRILSNSCNIDFSGINVSLQINVQHLKVTYIDTNERFFQHTMQNISFACGGDTEIQDFVAYVAKDDEHGRACYVFECPNGLANHVITTIGQAFELRFKNFISSNMPNLNSNHNHNNNNNNNSGNTSSNNTSSSNNSNNNQNLNHHPTNSTHNNNHNHNHINNNRTPILTSPTRTNNNNNNNINNNNNKYKLDSNNIAHSEQINHSNHFDSTTNTNSLASTSTQLKTPINTNLINNNQNTNHKIDLPPKNFNPKVEQLGILSNNTNTNNNKQIVTNGSSNGTPTIHGRIDEKLEKMKWFHGLLTREMAEKLLVRDGDYLVRETNKADRQYVLSGRYKGECRHIFLVDPSGIVRTKDRVFENICHLIQYHQENNIPIISKDNELLLEHPVLK